MRVWSVLILIAFIAGCAGGAAATKETTEGAGMSGHAHEGHEHTFTRHYDNSLFTVTDEGLYSVELVIKDGALFVGPNDMDIIIHDQEDRDVTGATIEVSPWMPAHGHGVPQAPVIMERGGGLYTAENVYASMPGRWELKIKVSADSGPDTAMFDFPDVMQREAEGGMAGHHAHHMGDMAHDDMVAAHHPQERDYSTTKESRRGHYTVTYQPVDDTIPLRRMHAWQVDITDKDGNPLEGADLEVEGWMPEHGHGMGSIPEVTPEGGGVYLVEGMGFSMPGFWTVTVRIRYQDMVDSVIFHLDLK